MNVSLLRVNIDALTRIHTLENYDITGEIIGNYFSHIHPERCNICLVQYYVNVSLTDTQGYSSILNQLAKFIIRELERT